MKKLLLSLTWSILGVLTMVWVLYSYTQPIKENLDLITLYAILIFLFSYILQTCKKKTTLENWGQTNPQPKHSIKKQEQGELNG